MARSADAVLSHSKARYLIPFERVAARAVCEINTGAEGFRLGKIAYDRFAADAFEVFEVAGLADEKTEVCPLCCEGMRHMVAYESGGACKENFHCEPSWQRPS